MALASSGDQSVVLWLKPEPFIIGSLQTPPDVRLTTNNIKKIVGYAKKKGRSGFPNLSYSVWKHIACNKLSLNEDVAWTYFVTFSLVGEVGPEEHLEFDKKAAADDSRNLLTAPTLRFVLFLYVQHIHKISLRASLVSGSDEWPTRARSPDVSGRSSAGEKALDESTHLTFVLNNLDVILDILTESEPRNSPASTRDSRDLSLSLEAVEALEYLITGSFDQNKTVFPLHEIASLPSLHKETGYSKASGSFSFRSLQTWLRSHLTQNPFGVLCTLSQGRHLSWPMFGETRERWAERKRGRIVTNALLLPKDQTRWNKLIVMSQVSQQTVARSSATLKGSTVKIHRCHNAFIYLLSPLRAVSIEKCHNTTVVVGSVELSVDVVRSTDTTVIGVSRRVTVIGSTSCLLHIMTPNRPLVYSGNKSLVFAPYHTFYPQLEVHMEQVGVQPHPNYWDTPLYVGADHADDDIWELMDPSEFHEFVIPFQMEGNTEEVPGGLPLRYQKALAERSRSLERWKTFVRDGGLTKKNRRTFQQVVEAAFQDWLQSSGQFRQLDGLTLADDE